MITKHGFCPFSQVDAKCACMIGEQCPRDHVQDEVEQWVAERSPICAQYVNNEMLMKCDFDNEYQGVPEKGTQLVKNQEFKADGGKLEPSLLFAGMPRALYAVIAVLQYGKQKYEAHSWKRVDGDRYDDARLRHVLDNYLEPADKESGLAHMAHEATNCLFQLEKTLEALGADWRKALVFLKPPQDHKK